jgi:predicted nucleic-acid-binding protein
VRAVDTDVLVRLVARDDARQVASAEAFVAQGAWISHLVLVEAVWVLSSVYECDAAGIVAAVEMLLDHKDLTLQDPDAVKSALARFRKKSSLSFSDCLVLEAARKAGHLPLGTFDRDLGKQEGAQRL